MALKAAFGKYINATVPAAGTPVTAVATTSTPTPVCDDASTPIILDCGMITTIATVASANTDTWRVAILPANHIILDAALEIGTGNGGNGKLQLVLLNQACAATDAPTISGGVFGGTAGTIDTPITSSVFYGPQVTTAAGVFRRTTPPIPIVATSLATKAASAGIPVNYDRVVGLQTETAIAIGDITNVRVFLTIVAP
jgi:hypothetical protein